MWIREPEQVEHQVTPPTRIKMQTNHIGAKQAVANRKILECVSVGEEVELILYMIKWKDGHTHWKNKKILHNQNTKEENHLEEMKRRVEKAALEWDDFVLQENLKSLMNVDRWLCGDPKKEKAMDELDFKNWMRFKRNTTSKFFVGIKVKGSKFIIHPEYFDTNNIFSHRFLQNLNHRPNVFQYLSTPTKKLL